MKKYILFILFINTFQLSIAQKIDSSAVINGRRGSSAVPTSSYPTPTQITENQKVIVKNDSLKTDTTKQKKKDGYFSKAKYSPKKAALFSLILPGAGQIYNKTGVWWKLPLCYGAYGATIYFIRQNQIGYKKYYNIYANYVFDKTYKNAVVSKAIADTNRQAYQKRLAYSWLGLFGAHLFCVSDAFVTAHLNQFDIDDNLTLKVSPASESVGVKFNFTF